MAIKALPADYTIRPIREDDVKHTHLLSKALGWSATQQDWANDIHFAKKSSFVVTYKDDVIGVGLGLPYETHTRLARIIIHPDHQKKGLGSALVEHLITCAKVYRYTRLELDATEAGKPLYLKFGFKFQNQTVTLIKEAEKTDRIGTEHLQNPCPRCQEADLDQIEALDKKAFGASRRFYIERAFQQNPIFVSKQQEKVTGFILCILGENGIKIGAWRSENEADAEKLIKTVIHEFARFKKTIHIPQKHTVALALVDKLGFKVDYVSDTMRLGDDSIIGDPETEYARWSLALG